MVPGGGGGSGREGGGAGSEVACVGAWVVSVCWWVDQSLFSKRAGGRVTLI